MARAPAAERLERMLDAIDAHTRDKSFDDYRERLSEASRRIPDSLSQSADN